MIKKTFIHNKQWQTLYKYTKINKSNRRSADKHVRMTTPYSQHTRPTKCEIIRKISTEILISVLKLSLFWSILLGNWKAKNTDVHSSVRLLNHEFHD